MKWFLFVLFVNGGSISGLPVKEFKSLEACRAAAQKSAATLSFNSSGLACVRKVGALQTGTSAAP